MSTSSDAGASPRQARFDSPEQEAFLNLWRTYDCLKGLEDELFTRYQLSAQQYNALRLLRSVSPQAMPTLMLARRLISRSPDITRMLDRLDDRGLIQRARRDDNRRIVEISITPSGVALLDELARGVRDMHERQLGHLSPADRQSLVKLLKKARLPHDDATCDWLD
jgi:DNA-binding MarR family transcriptional regulator